MSNKEYIIKKVEEIPSTGYRGLRAPYHDILEEIDSKGTGCYEVELKGKVPATVYLGLQNEVKNFKGMTVHKRKDTIFVRKE
jgi:hypothetical protein